MKRIKTVGLCLVVLFAMSAVVATSASAALPEWLGPVPTSFTSQNMGSGGVLAAEYITCESEKREPGTCIAKGETETISSVGVECESERDAGEMVGVKAVENVVIAFRGCKLFGSIPCSNTANEGEIATNTLKGKLGWITKVPKDVGLYLTPVLKHGNFAAFTCLGGLEIVIGEGNKRVPHAYHEKDGCAYATCGGDSVISSIEPIDQKVTKFTQRYTTGPGDENIPEKLLKRAATLDVLESYLAHVPAEPFTESSKWSKASLTLTDVMTTTRSIEITA